MLISGIVASVALGGILVLALLAGVALVAVDKRHEASRHH